MKQPTKTKLVSAREIAAEVGVTAKTIQNIANAGKLPHYRVGKTFRFNLKECLESFRK